MGERQRQVKRVYWCILICQVFVVTIDRQTNRQTFRQTFRQTVIQTDRETDIQTDRTNEQVSTAID